MRNKNTKLIYLLLASLLLFSGCGNSKDAYSSSQGADMKNFASSDGMTFNSISGSASYEAGENYYVEEEIPIQESAPTSKNEGDSSVLNGAKLIRDVYINMETTNLDSIIEEMEKRIADLGGYIQDVDMYNYSNSRSYTIEIRIPYKKVDMFLNGIEEFGTIKNMNDSTRDITLTYAGAETRLANLNKQHERLLKLLDKSDNLTEIIELEARLSDVETEIDSYSLEIKNYDNLVNYSTISLNIEERDYVSTNVDNSLWGRITSGLSDNLHEIKENIFDFIVWFVVHIPNIIIWSIVIFVIFLLVKKIKKKPFKILRFLNKKKKTEEKDNKE